MLTRHVANEGGEHGVRVNCLAPHTVLVGRTRRVMPEERRQMAAEIALVRLGTPEDVALAALFFASDSSSWITGATLDVAGGLGHELTSARQEVARSSPSRRGGERAGSKEEIWVRSTDERRRGMEDRSRQVEQFAQEWAVAEQREDAAFLEGALVDDFVGIGPLGFMLTKEQWLGRYAGAWPTSLSRWTR